MASLARAWDPSVCAFSIFSYEPLSNLCPLVYHIHDQPVPSDGNCTGTLAHLDRKLPDFALAGMGYHMTGCSSTHTRVNLSIGDVRSGIRDVHDAQPRIRNARLLCSSCYVSVRWIS